MERGLVDAMAPGTLLREEIEERGWTQQDLADVLGRPLQAINEILQTKKAVTFEMAILLGKALGTSPEFWLSLEQNYRLELAKSESVDDEVEKKGKVFSVAPIRELVKRGWLGVKFGRTSRLSKKEIDSLINAVLEFFDVNSLDEIETKPLWAFLRTSCDDTGATSAIRAWLQRSQHCAKKIVTNSRYTAKKVEEALPALKRSSMQEMGGVLLASKMLLEVGVRLVFVPHLQRTKVDGATLWLSKDEPIISMSLRYSRIDNFWFTLFHEIGHVLLDGYSTNGTVDEQVESKKELPRELAADRFAQDNLVSQPKMSRFLETNPVSKAKILEFAKEEGVHPGIVVGQLQHRGAVQFGEYANLQGKFDRKQLFVLS